jgi:hypothetical protein
MICLYYKRFEDIQDETIYQTNKVKIDDNDLCIFCLEGNILSFYKYDDKKLIHNCECRPLIHKECFYDFLSKKQECIICCEIINKELSIYDKFKIKFKESLDYSYYVSFYILLIYAFSRFMLFNFYLFFFMNVE